MVELETLTWDALLAELEHTPERLRALLARGAPTITCGPAAPETRSVCDIVSHLCALESPYRARLARIVLEANPRVAMIDRFTGGYDPETPISILVDTFTLLRADTLVFLRSLPPAARVRPAVHAEFGPVTLRGQVAALLEHDREHLAEIAAAVSP